MPTDQLGFDTWLKRDLQTRYEAVGTVPPDLLALLDQFPADHHTQD